MQLVYSSASVNDTTMGCSWLLILGLLLHVAHSLEILGKSAELQSICCNQLFMCSFYWTLSSCLT